MASIVEAFDHRGVEGRVSERATRIAGLDVIRGIAVGLVVLRHAWPNLFGGAGIVGVVLFFALSGYLITGLIVGDVHRFNRVRLRRFYLHRVFRLIPALLFLLVGFAVVTLTVDPLGDRGHMWRSIGVAAAYLSDLSVAPVAQALSHLWTLAVEEQFYLVWPALVVIAVRRGAVGLLLLVSGVGLWLLCAATLWAKHPEYQAVYALPTSWSIVMVIGAAAQIYRAQLEESIFRSVQIRRSLGFGSLLVLLVVSFVPEAKNWAGSYLLLGPLVGLCGVGLIFWMGQWRALPTRAMGPLVALGTISYAVYLWDWPVVKWLAPDGVPSAMTGLASVPIVLALATASYLLVERPATRFRKSLDARSPSGLGRRG